MGSTATAEIARMLGSIHDRDHYTVLRDFFELSAISIRNAVDFGCERDTYERRYKAIAEKYRKEYLDIIASAFAMLGSQILKAANGDIPFADWAGEIYMDSGTSNGRAGQFFTPYHVSHLMAECSLERDEMLGRIGKDPDDVITIYEPTCGAGGLIVASIDVLKGYGVNYSWNVFVDCGDIDPRCVHMTYVTLSLLGVPAVVRLGDALMMKYHEAWFTPAYLMAWPHFRSRIGPHRYPYEPTVKAPSRAQAEAAADAGSPKAEEMPRMPENKPRIEKKRAIMPILGQNLRNFCKKGA
jgi:hypothetical protein